MSVVAVVTRKGLFMSGNAILESAGQLNIKTNLVDLKNAIEAQNTPCAFGSFCLINNGKIISHHPISNGRFLNIMKKELK